MGVWSRLRIGVTCLSLAGVAHAGPKPSEPAVHNQAAAKERAAGGEQAAADPAKPNAGDPGAEAAAEEQALGGAWEAGPKQVVLGNQVTVELPAGYAYLPPEPSKKLLEANGSFGNDGVLGLFASTNPNENWFVVSSFEESGFIKDDEELDGDEILDELRGGLDEANEERKQHGFKPLALDGWAETPRYEKSQHHVVWALIVSDADGKSVNYNTRVLGRKGYVSLNLVTDPNTLAQDKHHATTLLSVTRFDSGARYEDFNEDSDKVAEYGLAGLVMAGAGLGAAKLVKLGLLAKFSKVIIAALIAGKKFLVLGVAALYAVFRKFIGGNKTQTPPNTPAE